MNRILFNEEKMNLPAINGGVSLRYFLEVHSSEAKLCFAQLLSHWATQEFSSRLHPRTKVRGFRRRRIKTGIILASVLMATFLAMSPCLKSPFSHLDDDVHLVENSSIRALDGRHLKAMFTRTASKIYIPLTYLTFALEYKFFEYNPFVYHLINLLLHLAVTALIFILARRWGLSLIAAAIGSLLFGIHPMHVESVAWITERKDVLYSLFYLLAIYQYQNYLRWLNPGDESAAGKKQGGEVAVSVKCAQEKRRRRMMLSLLGSIFFGLLSLLSKPMAVSLPLILLLCDWMKGRRFNLRIFLEKIPYALFIIPITWITYSLHARIPGRNVLEGTLIWIWSLTFYIKTFFFPLLIMPARVLPKPISIFEPTYLFAGVIFLLSCFCLYLLRKQRWFIFAGLYFFASIFFLLRYDDVWDANIVADRFMYLPSLGFCLWLGFWADQAIARAGKKRIMMRSGVTLLVSLILIGLFTKTFLQTKLWGDELKLWTKVIAWSPNSFFAYHSRGNVYIDKKEYDQAIADFSQAIKIKPNYDYAYGNRGLAYYHEGQKDLALLDYNTSLKIRPHQDNVYINRGLLYTDFGKYNLAMKDLNKALSLNPDNPYAYNNRGGVYFKTGQLDLALRDYNKALKIKKDLVKAYVSRGNVYLKRNLHDLAMRDYNAAIKYDPMNGNAYFNRSLLYYAQKNFPAALADALKAQSLGSKVAESYLADIKNMIANSSQGSAKQ